MRKETKTSFWRLFSWLFPNWFEPVSAISESQELQCLWYLQNLWKHTNTNEAMPRHRDAKAYKSYPPGINETCLFASDKRIKLKWFILIQKLRFPLKLCLITIMILSKQSHFCTSFSPARIFLQNSGYFLTFWESGSFSETYLQLS